MNTNEKIDRIRQLMKKKGISAVVIPRNDPHQSEYLAEHWQVGKWLTGFSGSAGTIVITSEHSILWTDFRYYIQAEQQLAGSCVELYKMGEPKVPTFQEWLSDTLESGDVIGLDGNLFSRAGFKKLEQEVEAKGLLVDTGVDLIQEVWTDRPGLPMSKAFALSERYAGRTRADKITKIRDRMKALGADVHLMAGLDDIAWTLNLRGQDVHTNPVNIAFVLVGPERLSLFMKRDKVDDDLARELGRDTIDLFDYADVFAALAKIEGGSILVDPENTNCAVYHSINKACKIVEAPCPAIGLKAVKNDVEIAHLRQTLVRDGAAVVKFLFWLEHQTGKDRITEISAAQKLFEFRKQQDLFVDNSFDPIMASGEHSAMCHYCATKETDVTIGRDTMFLTDSGGNYFTGTTDITRTIFQGSPSRQEIQDYTLVLKGHIAVATTRFPKGARGFQIDTLARQYLWNAGMDFGHGTGHGVGFFLCVHEGPARISPLPVDVRLEPGMVLTNEPGVYREGAYGIRLENMMLVDEAFENEFGVFMKFDTLTWCHFERNLMDVNLLSRDEQEWVDAYHEGVYERLSPLVDREVAAWLREKTRRLQSG
jgi:Xaa-Pro aminopeptidase